MCVANLPTFSNRTYGLRLVMRAFRLEIVATSRLESFDIFFRHTRCVECFHTIFRDQRIDPETGASTCVFVCVCVFVKKSDFLVCVTCKSTWCSSAKREKFLFFTFRLCHSNHKNLTRIAHSYCKKKSLENQRSNAHVIMMNT